MNECVRNRSHTLRNYMSKKLSKDSSVVVVMSVVGCETEHGSIGARAGLVTWSGSGGVLSVFGMKVEDGIFPIEWIFETE